MFGTSSVLCVLHDPGDPRSLGPCTPQASWGGPDCATRAGGRAGGRASWALGGGTGKPVGDMTPPGQTNSSGLGHMVTIIRK
eukprot:gene15291-biopygen9705